MTTELATTTENQPSYQGAFKNAENFESAQRMAQAICSSSIVPQIYQGNKNIGNTIIALEMAQRMNASPLMVMQNLYLVHGNPGWSSKFLIATFNQCGKFSAIRYEWEGTAGQKDRACRAYAYEKQTNERVEGPWINWALIDGEGWASKNGSKWRTMPEKMFAYRAAAWMIDTVAPELSMGLPPADQLADIVDITPVSEVADAKVSSFKDLLKGEAEITDIHGEVWNQSVHATGEDGQPVLNQDGSFRARRGTKTNHAEDQATPADPEFSFAQIAEMLNAAQSQDAIDEAMSLIGGLPDEQKGELRSLARRVAKTLEDAA